MPEHGGSCQHSQQIVLVSEQPHSAWLDAALSSYGYAVVTFSPSGADVARLAECPHHLVVVEVQFGERHGLACLRALQPHPLPPVLVVSTDPRLLEAIAARPAQYACDRALLLPVSLSRLTGTVEELIGPPA